MQLFCPDILITRFRNGEAWYARIIKTMADKYLISSLMLVETVFTEHTDAEEGSPMNYRPQICWSARSGMSDGS